MTSQITTTDLIGSSSLLEVPSFELEPKTHPIKESILTVKYSHKKVLAITIIAFVVGNIK
jgi:hypothetical protein